MMVNPTAEESSAIDALLQEIAAACHAHLGRFCLQVDNGRLDLPGVMTCAMIDVQEHARMGRRWRYWAVPDFNRFGKTSVPHPVTEMVDSICRVVTPQQLAHWDALKAKEKEWERRRVALNRYMSGLPQAQHVLAHFDHTSGGAEVQLALQVPIEDAATVMDLLAPLCTWLDAHNYKLCSEPASMRWMGSVMNRQQQNVPAD